MWSVACHFAALQWSTSVGSHKDNSCGAGGCSWNRPVVIVAANAPCTAFITIPRAMKGRRTISLLSCQPSVHTTRCGSKFPSSLSHRHPSSRKAACDHVPSA